MAVLMREAIGGSLRRMRTARRRTLRDVSRKARVSLGYLSEVERGRKEPSSELLAAICDALDVALAELLSDAAETLDAAAAADAAAARPQRLVGLRHMDLRLAGADDVLPGPLHPGAPPLAPIAPVAAPASTQPTPGRVGAVRAAA
jgi:transcriptional regulator with XRE-family HTH domain